LNSLTLRQGGKVLTSVEIDDKTQASLAKERASEIWKRLVQYVQADLNDKGELENFRGLVEQCMAWNGLVGVPEDVIAQKTHLFKTIAARGRRATIRNIDPFKLFDDGIKPEEGAIKYQKEFVPILKWLARNPAFDDRVRAQYGKEAAVFLWKHGDEEISLHLAINANTKRAFYSLKVERYGTIASPICRFILDRLDQYARVDNKDDVIPLRTCVYCSKVMFFERSSRKTCSDACRVAMHRKGV